MLSGQVTSVSSDTKNFQAIRRPTKDHGSFNRCNCDGIICPNTSVHELDCINS